MIALALAGVCLGQSSGTPALLKDPYAIFAGARTHWELAHYPPQLSYTVAITVKRRGVVSEAHYHSYYDSLANRVSVNAVSDEEIANPYTPHGIDVFFRPFGGSIPLSSPERTFDYLGVPVLAPNYSFGISTYFPHSLDADSALLVAQIRREFCDPAPPNKVQADSGLRTIASIEVARRSYVITLDGVSALNGHKDYALSLRPVSDPGRYRLRELWINAQTLATDRLVSQGNFTQAGTTSVRWTVDFREVDGALYISSERTNEPFVMSRRAYDSAVVAFGAISPKRIPPMMQISNFAANSESGVPPLLEP